MSKLIDLKGKKFGKLSVLYRDSESSYINGEALWTCICSCDKKTIIKVPGSQLRQNKKKSCGCLRNPSYDVYIKQLQIRLLANTKLNVKNQCIEWQGYKNRLGYGQTNYTINKIERPIPVHRAAWMIYKGPIPAGMQVCHHCDNPSCCRIEHLFLGTALDNMRDKIKKGRDRYRKGSACINAILNENKVKKILSLKGKKTSHQLSKEYNISASGIRSIWQRRTWKHVRIEE